MTDLVIRGRGVVTPEGVRSASVHVAGGRIVRLGRWEEVPPDVPVVDAGESIVMPGLVDTHVHINEPGRTEWEGFDTGTRAAAAGGVTTILDMPLNSIPATTTVNALEAKRKAAHGKSVVNVEFIGGVVPGNVGELEGLRDAGVRAFKCFLSPSGVDEFPAVSERDLREAFPVLARLGLPLMVHAEDPACLLASRGSSRKYGDYLDDAASRGGAHRDHAIDSVDGADSHARPHRSPVLGELARHRAHRPRERTAVDRRDVSALSHLRGGRDSRRCHGVQVCSAHP